MSDEDAVHSFASSNLWGEGEDDEQDATLNNHQHPYSSDDFSPHNISPKSVGDGGENGDDDELYVFNSPALEGEDGDTDKVVVEIRSVTTNADGEETYSNFKHQDPKELRRQAQERKERKEQDERLAALERYRNSPKSGNGEDTVRQIEAELHAVNIELTAAKVKASKLVKAIGTERSKLSRGEGNAETVKARMEANSALLEAEKKNVTKLIIQASTLQDKLDALKK